jgi:hypothetical protein
MGEREGLGMFVWSHGSRYEGSFKCNKRCGKGMFVYPDGRVYTGDYDNDMPHGYGVEKIETEKFFEMERGAVVDLYRSLMMSQNFRP